MSMSYLVEDRGCPSKTGSFPRFLGLTVILIPVCGVTRFYNVSNNMIIIIMIIRATSGFNGLGLIFQERTI